MSDKNKEKESKLDKKVRKADQKAESAYDRSQMMRRVWEGSNLPGEKRIDKADKRYEKKEDKFQDLRVKQIDQKIKDLTKEIGDLEARGKKIEKNLGDTKKKPKSGLFLSIDYQTQLEGTQKIEQKRKQIEALEGAREEIRPSDQTMKKNKSIMDKFKKK